LAEKLSRFASAHSFVTKYLHCSSSKRGVETAEILGRALSCDKIKKHAELRSTNAGPYAGLSVRALQRKDSEWMEKFHLYKAGLLNLYNFDSEWQTEGKESKVEFEQRVLKCFREIVGQRNEPLKIIVANRSAIIAILISLARELYNYPNGFYGYVRVDLGSVSRVQRDNRGKWRIVGVNENWLIQHKL